LTKTGPGTLMVNGVRSTGLTVNAGTVQIPQAAGTSKVSTLTIAIGAKLDLTSNNLVVVGGTLGSWNGSDYTGVTGLIRAGRNGGVWNGGGSVTRQSGATTSNPASLGLAQATRG